MHYKVYGISLIMMAAIASEAFPPISFQESMGFRPIRFGLISKEDIRWWQILQELYERYPMANTVTTDIPKIPKIIHQVWVGPHPFPAQFEAARQSIIQHHPDWEYRLWTDQDVESFGLVNKNLFDAARNYGEKSDIFRYEILERYGGVYLDVDMECIKPLDILHHNYEFYTGILNTGHVELGIGIIGAAPHHPIMKLCISAMRDSGSKTDFMDIINRSGPFHFTKCFMALAEHCAGTAIALPVGYFYPIPNTEKNYRTREQAEPWIRPETFTVHYWGCTWQGARGAR